METIEDVTLTPQSKIDGAESTTHGDGDAKSNVDAEDGVAIPYDVSDAAVVVPAFTTMHEEETKKRPLQVRQLDYKQKKAICLKKQSSPGMTQEALRMWAQVEFTLLKPPGQSTISDILKHADTILALDARALENKRVRSVTYPELDTALANWVLQCQARTIKVSNDLIKAQAAVLCDLLGIPPNAIRFSGGWLESFKYRHGFNAFTVFGRTASSRDNSTASRAIATTNATNAIDTSAAAAAAATAATASFMDSTLSLALLPVAAPVAPSPPIAATASDDRLQQLRSRLALVRPCDVYAAHETPLIYTMDDGTTTARRCNRVTVLLCTNADATDRREPLVIGAMRQPMSVAHERATHDGVVYRNNKRAWMTGLLFRDWLIRFDSAMLAAKRSVVLLLTPATSHVVMGLELTNVDVQLVPPLTDDAPLNNPLDAGAMRAFRLSYRLLLLQHALEHAEEQWRRNGIGGETDAMARLAAASRPTNVCCVSLLTAMRWIRSAWHDVARDTIVHCFRLYGVSGNSVPATAAAAAAIDTPHQALEQLARVLDANVHSTIDCVRATYAYVDAAIAAADDDERAAVVHQTFNPEDFVEHWTPDEEAAIDAADDSSSSATVLDAYSTTEKLDCVRTVLLLLHDFAGADERTIATLRRLQKHLRNDQNASFGTI